MRVSKDRECERRDPMQVSRGQEYETKDPREVSRESLLAWGLQIDCERLVALAPPNVQSIVEGGGKVFLWGWHIDRVYTPSLGPES